MSILVIVPTHAEVGGERGLSPGSPGQWTGEGARPLPAGGGTAKPPPRPASGILPRPLRGRGQCVAIPGKNLSGHNKLPERTGRALTDCPPTRITTVF